MVSSKALALTFVIMAAFCVSSAQAGLWGNYTTNLTDGEKCRFNYQCESTRCSWGGRCYTKASLLNAAQGGVEVSGFIPAIQQEESCTGVSYSTIALVSIASLFLGAYFESWRMRVKSRLTEGFLSATEYQKLNVMQKC